MGVDPLTIGLGATLVGSGLKAIGGSRDRHNQQVAVNQRTQGLQALQQTGDNPYASAIMQLLGGNMKVDPNTGAIDVSQFQNMQNPGQDALAQFLRSDPSKQTPFDASSAFQMLQGNDQLQQRSGLEALNANFGGSIGQRFGTAARRASGDFLANLGAQIGARNAGIAQSSYENAANRSLQGTGLLLQGATSMAQLGQGQNNLLAQLLMANQQNRLNNQQLNQQSYGQQIQGMLGAAGLQNQQNSYNLAIQQMIAGMPIPQGNAFSDFGGFLGQAGQAASFFPMLQGMGSRGPTAPGGFNLPSLPNLQVPYNLPNPNSFVDPAIYGGFRIPGMMY